MSNFNKEFEQMHKKTSGEISGLLIGNLAMIFLFPLFMKMGLDVVRDLWPALSIPVITYWQMFWLRIGAVSFIGIFKK